MENEATISSPSILFIPREMVVLPDPLSPAMPKMKTLCDSMILSMSDFMSYPLQYVMPLKQLAIFPSYLSIHMSNAWVAVGFVCVNGYTHMDLLYQIALVQAPWVVPALQELLARHESTAAQDVRVFEVDVLII